MDKDEKYVLLEQYRIYSDAKEKFIDREFTTNRFYLVLNIIVLLATYFLSALTPQYQPVIILSIIGLSISLMWWINIDTYQTMIKIKYANVLEYLETKLPERPYNKEYNDYKELKKQKHLIVFSDFQKILTIIIAGIYFFALVYNVANMIKFQML